MKEKIGKVDFINRKNIFFLKDRENNEKASYRL